MEQCQVRHFKIFVNMLMLMMLLASDDVDEASDASMIGRPRSPSKLYKQALTALRLNDKKVDKEPIMKSKF